MRRVTECARGPVEWLPHRPLHLCSLMYHAQIGEQGERKHMWSIESTINQFGAYQAHKQLPAGGSVLSLGLRGIISQVAVFFFRTFYINLSSFIFGNRNQGERIRAKESGRTDTNSQFPLLRTLLSREFYLLMVGLGGKIQLGEFGYLSLGISLGHLLG